MDLPEHLTLETVGHVGRRVRIFLDGVEVREVVEAHTGEGWLIRVCRDAAGKFMLTGDPQDPDIATERLTGRVTAELRD